MGMKAGVQALMRGHPKVRATACVIRSQCRTHVFQFPGTELVSAEHLAPTSIVQRPNAEGTIVSDLLGYFREYSAFQHYATCCSLRSKIGEEVSKHVTASDTNRLPLFVIVEQHTPCETSMEDGTCYVVDQEMLTGGSAGKEAIFAWKVDDAPWPQLDEEDSGFVNTVLAAVAIVENEIGPIREVAESSCFCDEKGTAVYPITADFRLGLSVSSPATEADLREKVAQLRAVIGTLEAKRQIDETYIGGLVDALKLQKIETDHYRRASYLSLFEATKAVLSRHDKQQFHQRHRDYRKTIGHPKAKTKMDMEEFRKLRLDVLSELRKEFLEE